MNSQKRDSKIPDETETDEVGEDGDEVVEYPTDPDSQGQTFLFQREMQELLASLSPKESTCSSRRSSIKEGDSLFGHLTSKRKTKHVRIRSHICIAFVAFKSPMRSHLNGIIFFEILAMSVNSLASK